jgi:hypothetical protein
VNADRSRKTTFMGTYVTTGGTGRLKGIKGSAGPLESENTEGSRFEHIFGRGEYRFSSA